MVRRFKGFNYVGSTILGYRLVGTIDHGAIFEKEKDIKCNSGEDKENKFYLDKTIRKVTYRKKLKTANRE